MSDYLRETLVPGPADAASDAKQLREWAQELERQSAALLDSARGLRIAAERILAESLEARQE